MACLVTGNANSGCGGAAVDIIGQADHIGSGIKMVCQAAGNALDANAGDAIGREHPAGGLRAGKTSAAELLGIALEGAVYIGTGPQRKNDTGQHQDHIGPIETVIIGHKTTPLKISGKHLYTFYPKGSHLARL